MIFNKRNTQGITLIETILALAIAGATMMMGVQLYQSFSKDTAVKKIQYNVDLIMRGAAYYYYANCQNSSGITATLDPANSPANPFVKAQVSDLVTAGFIKDYPTDNALVDSTGANKGYLIQFNLSTPTKYNCPQTKTTCDPIGTSIIWRIQVSALLADVKNATKYLNMSGADCLATMKANGTTLTTCKESATFKTDCAAWRVGTFAEKVKAIQNCPPVAGGVYGNYLSWERLPSMVSPQEQSPLWLSNPGVRQFKNFVEHPDINAMVANPTTNFLCGS